MILSRFRAEKIGKDTEDERARYCGYRDFAESKGQAAYAGDKDNGYNEEVAVVAEVYLLYHFKTGYRDEAVERDAHAAHYAGRYGCEEGRERSDKGDYDCHYRGCEYRYYGSISGDSDASDRFAVSGVGATAEERARNRTYAVAEKSSVKPGGL